MNNDLIQEIQKAISQLQKEIKEKQNKLDDLITQYQELSGIEIYDENDENNN